MFLNVFPTTTTKHFQHLLKRFELQCILRKYNFLSFEYWEKLKLSTLISWHWRIYIYIYLDCSYELKKILWQRRTLIYYKHRETLWYEQKQIWCIIVCDDILFHVHKGKKIKFREKIWILFVFQEQRTQSKRGNKNDVNSVVLLLFISNFKYNNNRLILCLCKK